jgi:ADP-ribose pyrophosphatase YjhB (NUDIX family)
MNNDNLSYTIRVYAILVNEHNEVLLMDESYRGIEFTKFPGGGLEWGEGILACAERELREELSLENITLEQFYTTDFFVESYFDTTTQVISVYYKCPQPIQKDAVEMTKHDTRLLGMKWVPLAKLTPDDVTFPIDKKVVGMVTNY